MTDLSSWVIAGASSVTALVGLVTAGLGLRQLVLFRADSRERSRPMMAAELRKDPYSPGTQILAIRNYGQSIARHVHVSFDPPIPDPDVPAQSITPDLKRRYEQAIPTITPGMELRNIWYSARADKGKWVNAEPTPEQFTVTITYRGPDKHSYKDTFPLDTSLIGRHTYTDSSTDPDNILKNMRGSLQSIDNHLGQLVANQRRKDDGDQTPA